MYGTVAEIVDVAAQGCYIGKPVGDHTPGRRLTLRMRTV